jgi:Ca2+-transporting ATPase
MNTALTRGPRAGRGDHDRDGDRDRADRRDAVATEREPTPLQRQIDSLSKTLAAIAGVVIVVVIVLGLLRGQPFESLFVGAVSLAVAAIPEGLPAVVAFTLAMGAAGWRSRARSSSGWPRSRPSAAPGTSAPTRPGPSP